MKRGAHVAPRFFGCAACAVLRRHDGSHSAERRASGPGTPDRGTRPTSRAVATAPAPASQRAGIRELRQHASIYVDLAEKDHTVDITNRGAQPLSSFRSGSRAVRWNARARPAAVRTARLLPGARLRGFTGPAKTGCGNRGGGTGQPKGELSLTGGHACRTPRSGRSRSLIDIGSILAPNGGYSATWLSPSVTVRNAIGAPTACAGRPTESGPMTNISASS
jgi:hypothetical protein